MNIIVSTKQFLPTTKNAMIIGNSLGHDLTISKSGKYHNVNTKTLIEGLGPCVGLTMWTGKNKFNAHSAPELEPINTVGEKISVVIETLRGKLKNSFDEVHAFITGGVAYDSQNPVSRQSMDLISEMYETLFKEGVPNVVIAGQKSDGIKTRLDTVAFGDNIFLTGKPIDSIVKSEKSLEDEIEEQFDFVEFSKNIPVGLLK